MVEQYPIIIYSKLNHGKGTSCRSCGVKSNYTTAPKLFFTEAIQPKISFSTIYSVCGVIKRFTAKLDEAKLDESGRAFISSIYGKK